MKKFLQILALVPWILAPIACTQHETVTLTDPALAETQNVGTDASGKDQDEQDPPQARTDPPSIHLGDNTATMPVYTQEEAEEVIQALLEIDTNEGLLASLTAAGYVFEDLGDLTKALKVGAFPPKVVDHQLLQFFYVYDPVFGNKVDWVQGQSTEEARDLKTKAALLRLVVLLDMVYSGDVVRDGNRNFSIGVNTFKLTITGDEYLVDLIQN